MSGAVPDDDFLAAIDPSQWEVLEAQTQGVEESAEGRVEGVFEPEPICDADMEDIESIESSLNGLIERGAQQSKAAQDRADLYAESVRRYRAQIQRENREAWARYHEEQAERLIQTATELAEKHRSRAESLLAGGSLAT